MSNTRTAFRQRSAPPANANAVAVIEPPRLAFPPAEALAGLDNIDQGIWTALVESVWPAAKTTGAVLLALNYCKARKLDPFKKVVHIVPMYDSIRRKTVETVWPGIAEYRTTAMRTGTYAGLDKPTFGPMVTETFAGNKKIEENGGERWEKVSATVTFPEWCEITVYRIVQGHKVQFPGPRTLWREFYARQSRWVSVPNERWQNQSVQMIEKCAEAGALRRAFPEELGGEHAIEEVGAFQTFDPSEEATPETATDQAEPRREDFEGPTDADPGITDTVDLSETVFERFTGPKAFFGFSDHFLQETTTTPDMARKWEEFYRDDINKMTEHADARIKAGIKDTIELYAAAVAREEPAT